MYVFPHADLRAGSGSLSRSRSLYRALIDYLNTLRVDGYYLHLDNRYIINVSPGIVQFARVARVEVVLSYYSYPGDGAT